MYTWRHAEFVSRFNGPLFTLWFPFHSTFLNLVHIKASGGINFNEIPEKLLTKFRSFGQKVGRQNALRAVPLLKVGRLEPSH